MKPRYTKRQREQAALICQIAASGCAWAVYTNDAAVWLGISRDDSSDDPPAEILAREAVIYVESRMIARRGEDWSSVPADRSVGWWRDNSAEAQCLLLDGWSPGDEVLP